MIRAATASLNSCVVVPGMFESTLPVQPVGTVMVGQNVRFQAFRTAVRVEMSYQLVEASGVGARAFPPTPLSSDGRSSGAVGGSPISGTCPCKDDARLMIRGAHEISKRQVRKNVRIVYSLSQSSPSSE